MNNQSNQNRLTGEAGVMRVASELLLRGLVPCFPSVDCGADLIVDGGTRIQVKSSHLRSNYRVYPQGAYWFKLAHACGKKRGQRRNFSKDCDFVVLWGIEHDKFWIVPSADFDNHSLVVVGPSLHWKNLNVDEIKEMHDSGMTKTEIAKHLGVNDMTIARRLNGVHSEPSERRSLTVKAREGEERWDLILNAVAIMMEIPLLVTG